MNLCLSDRLDAVKFSDYVERLPKPLREAAKLIYDVADNNGLYCPEIRYDRHTNVLLITWTYDTNTLIAKAWPDKQYIECTIKDSTLVRSYTVDLLASHLHQLFIELSMFINS
jgi:hypothetical protein